MSPGTARPTDTPALACWMLVAPLAGKAALAVVSSVFVAAVALVAFGIFIVLAYRRQWQWTGLPAPREQDNGASERSAKTLWDWLQLLGIPVALAALAFLLNDAQTQRDRKREEAQILRDQRREDQRAAQQQDRAADAEREDTLRAYLTQMSDLMLNDDLRRSKSRADVRKVARTATLTTVRRLDGSRKGLVVRFLYEADLLSTQNARLHARVALGLLTEADLSAANLRGANLFGADFTGADLSAANLTRASLRNAHLVGANLTGANLSGANLREARLPVANLRGANLRDAFLRRADLVGAFLSGANLRGADLGGANLRVADLRKADLREADLVGAFLSGANLRGADLRGARHAELADTRGNPAHRP